MKKKMKEAFILPPIGGAEKQTAASENNMGGTTNMGGTGMDTPNKNLGGIEGGSQRTGSAERLEDGLDGLAKRPGGNNRRVAQSEIGGFKG